MKPWLIAGITFALHRVLPGPWVEALALGAVLTLGIAHGAVDPLLARGRAGFVFYASYAAVALAVLLVWWLTPSLALLGFLAASVVHFGAGDARNLTRPTPSAIVARGLMVVGLPLALHPAEVLPIIGALGVVIPEWSSLEGATLAALVVAWNVLTARRSGAVAVIDVLVLALSFAVLPPLVSFALYFTAWHAVDHFRDLRHLDPHRLARRAVLGCLISWAGIALFACATSRWVAPEARWAVVFGFLSAVTAPHMIVVARAHRSPRRSTAMTLAPSWSSEHVSSWS